MLSLKYAIMAGASALALGTAAAASDVASDDQGNSATVQSVIVVAPREEVIARQRQQQSLNMVNVQSIETIEKYPDFNAAEALGRIPGVSLSSDTGEGRFVNIRGIDANLNGATFGGIVLLNTNAGGTAASTSGRAVEFDTVPSGAIDGIVVTKTRLPEQEGEGLGGIVELTPRSAAHISKPFLNATLGWGYEPLHDHTGPFDAEFSAGAAFGLQGGKLSVKGVDEHDGVASGFVSNPTPFSFVIFGSRKDDRRGIDDMEEGYLDDQSVSPTANAGVRGKAVSGYDFRRYDYHRRRFSYGGEFDFTPNDDHQYYARIVIAGYTEAVHKNFYLLRNMGGAETASGSLPTLSDGVTFIDSAQARETSTDEQETHRNTVLAVGGKDQFNQTLIDYRASYSRATFSIPYNIGATFKGPTFAIEYNNTTDARYPSFTYPTGFNPSAASNYNLSSIKNSTENDVDEEWSYAANAQTPLHLLGDKDTLKFGFEARLRDKTINSFTVDGITAPSLNLAVASSAANIYYDGYYSNGPFIDRYAIRNILAGEASGLSLSDNGSLKAKENVGAGYGEYIVDIGKWNFLTGARVESTDAKYTDSQTLSKSYTDVLPTAQVKYNISPSMVVRAIYSTGLSRPGFLQVATAGGGSYSGGPGTYYVTEGNAQLKPITGDNFDLSFEYYLPTGGIFQAALFDKEFSNYIAPRIQHITSGALLTAAQLPSDATDAFITSYFNIPSAYDRGLELAFHEQFKMLPGYWSGFGVEANYTVVDSRFLEYSAANSISGTNEYGPLPGTSHVTWNLAGFYEKSGLEVRLSGEYVGHSLFGLSGGLGGAGDRELDTIQDKRLTMDFASSYKVDRRWTVYFNVKNLLNTPLRYYEGETYRPIQREFYDVTYEGGIRAKF